MHLRHWSCWLLGQACGWWRWRSLLGWTLDQSVADQLDQPKPRSRDTDRHFEWADPNQPLVFRQSSTGPLPKTSSPLHLQFLTCTSASLNVSIRHLERIPFVPLWQIPTEIPTYHIGVERRSNPLVVQVIPVYWAEEYVVLYLKLHRKQGEKVSLLPALLFQHLPAGFIALSGWSKTWSYHISM